LTVGSTWYPFDRLIKAVDELAAGSREEFFLQTGKNTYQPKNAKWKPYLSFQEMVEIIKKSRIVISHAGAGTILLCLNLGKSPIVVPRDPARGEHIDHHQNELCERLAKEGRLTIVHNLEELPIYINEESKRATDTIQNNYRDEAPLVLHLRELVKEWFGPGRDSSDNCPTNT
jgi:UDP-N-acetylglucosamine transferase subunit ALG13